jgi:hypothetical protein
MGFDSLYPSFGLDRVACLLGYGVVVMVMMMMPVVMVMAVVADGCLLDRRRGMHCGARDQRGGVGRNRQGERQTNQKGKGNSEAYDCRLIN